VFASAAVLVLIAVQSVHAAGLLEDQVDLSSFVLLGCTDPDTCKEQSTSTTAELYSQGVDTLTARLGLNINASANAVGGAKFELGLAQYSLGFTVRSGGDYRLQIRVRRIGALRRTLSTLFCGGAVSLDAMAAPTASFNGDPPASIDELALPGATIGYGPFNYDQAVPDTVGERVLSRTGLHSADRYVINFAMSGYAHSDPCIVSMRLGAANGSTLGCPACEYPGDPMRTLTDDGLFVEVTVLDHCGNAVKEESEECDLGDQNGLPTSCCNRDCTFRSSDQVCRAAAGPCDRADLCDGQGGCPDQKQNPGHPCTDDGDACTADQCNDAGACIHLLIAELCPARACGNGAIDGVEECDAGVLNGAEGSCCGTDCKWKPNDTVCRPGTDECDPPDTCGQNHLCEDGRLIEDTPCADEGDFCTEDRCDGSGKCTHTPKPELCPSLFCGNGRIEGSERSATPAICSTEIPQAAVPSTARRRRTTLRAATACSATWAIAAPTACAPARQGTPASAREAAPLATRSTIAATPRSASAAMARSTARRTAISARS